MSENITRRSALSRTALATLALAAGGVAAVPAAASIGPDPILDLLHRRQGFMDILNAPGDDLEDDDPRRIAVDALETEIIGTPALTAAGALACLRAFASEGCRGDTDDWLLEAVTDFLQRRMWEEETTLRPSFSYE